MTDFSNIYIEPEEVISFLKRDLRLKEVYQQIVSRKIIARTAQELGLSVSEGEIQNELDRHLHEQRFYRPAAIAAWLDEQMLTWDDLELRVQEQLLANKLARFLFAQEVEDFFVTHQRDFERIVFYKIAVPYESLAQEIFYQIIEEEISFYEAAHLYDVDESMRLYCGYTGKQFRREMQPEIAELLFNATVGEVIGPVKAGSEMYELYWVDDVFASELTDEVYETLLHQRLEVWLSHELAVYGGDLPTNGNARL